ncbi:MAG: YiiX/YebB-like N1pC/P60 family cysteine hydrolase [bacterium]
MSTANELRTGDMIAFKKGKSIVAAVIHLFTNSDVNHVGIIVKLYNKIGNDFPFMIEANPDDVEYSFLPRKIKAEKDEIYVYRLTDENYKKLDDNLNSFYQFMNEQIGKAYDYPQAIETVVDKIFDKTISKDSYSKFFCSKLVGAIYLQAEIITPEMLAKSGFKCVSELTPADCCSLPIFKDNIKLTNSETEAKNVASKN